LYGSSLFYAGIARKERITRIGIVAPVLIQNDNCHHRIEATPWQRFERSYLKSVIGKKLRCAGKP
jgi:hypothetical protein